MKKRLLSFLLSLCMVLMVLAPSAQAAAKTTYDPSGWIGAWSTSPVEFNVKKILNLDMIKCDVGLHNLMFRSNIQPTVSGSAIRVTLTNQFGTGKLTVNSMTVAKSTGSCLSSFKLGTCKTITFGGSKSVTIPAGGTVTSDPIDMKVSALEHLCFSSFMKNTDTMKTFGLIGGDTFISTGNRTDICLPTGVPMKLNGDFGEYSVMPLISDIEVYHPNGGSVVVLGDSTIANDIPILLAEKLQAEGITNCGILQQAIKGNRLLEDGAGTLGMVYGQSIQNRLERDALNQPGVKAIILKVGVNDIVHPHLKSMKGKLDPVTAEQMIEGYKDVIRKAHAKGIKVYLCTRTAWKGYTRNILGTGDDIQWSVELDQVRVDINEWIRSSDNTADGYIELDSLCGDAEATQLKSGYTTDGAHLTPEGQKALVKLIPVKDICG